MDVRLRAYEARDFDFARRLYFETMRWAIERVFGWDEARQHASFAEWFKPEEISVITADGLDVGWIQQRVDDKGILLGSIYVAPSMQRKGIGSGVYPGSSPVGQTEIEARNSGSHGKLNPARALYERLLDSELRMRTNTRSTCRQTRSEDEFRSRSPSNRSLFAPVYQ